MPTAQIICCNCPSLAIAQQLATKLLEQRLAACINILPQVLSMYHWQGKIEQQAECTLLIKAPNRLFDAIKQSILEQHPYTVPEIIAIPIVAGHLEYLSWIDEECRTHV